MSWMSTLQRKLKMELHRKRVQKGRKRSQKTMEKIERKLYGKYNLS